MAREIYQYTVSQLWVYRGGVYLPCGEATLYHDAQDLLGNERRTDRINEALSYVQVATRRDDEIPPDGHYINLRNGRLNWQTIELEPHSASNFSTAQLPVEYDPLAVCPTFNKVSSGKAGGFTIAGPSKGPDRNRKVKTQNREDYERQTPGTVKLWESPGRAGGLP